MSAPATPWTARHQCFAPAHAVIHCLRTRPVVNARGLGSGSACPSGVTAPPGCRHQWQWSPASCCNESEMACMHVTARAYLRPSSILRVMLFRRSVSDSSMAFCNTCYARAGTRERMNHRAKGWCHSCALCKRRRRWCRPAQRARPALSTMLTWPLSPGSAKDHFVNAGLADMCDNSSKQLGSPNHQCSQ